MEGRFNQLTVGYYGKVASQGDFVTRGLTPAVETALDTWLRQSVRQSQQDLGRGWLDAFLVAPVWRMALGPGVAGPDTVAGVMMPSVDRVGRYFPLVVAAILPGIRPPLIRLAKSAAFYDAIEDLALSTLEEGFSLVAFEESMDSLRVSATKMVWNGAEDGHGLSLWWTGAALKGAFEAEAFPPSERYADLFLPRAVAGPAPVEPPPAPARAHDETWGLLDIDCHGTALKGTRSSGLAAATVISGDRQAMSLISGIGSNLGMPAAISGAATTLMGIENPYSMNDLVAEAKGKLGTVSAMLRARGIPSGQTFAASAVTLLIQAQRYAILWAGNARAYLLRDGTMVQLTRDHVDARLTGILTRALGDAANLSLDTSIGQARAGDRFLLASPGLLAHLSEAEIAETLSGAATAEQAVTRLTQDALISGAPLDVAAIAVMLSRRNSSVAGAIPPEMGN
ncbi:MAG: type VI secretion system-associated protein TagF [Tabrizicola sp.]|nr:type VI secretion system-associated protein TagF [Tabrizicola sp.]